MSFAIPARAQMACSSVFTEQTSWPPALVRTLEKLQNAQTWVAERTMGPSYRVRHQYDQQGWRTEAVRFLQFAYNTPVQMLNPLPVRTNRLLAWDAPANPILEKIWKNPAYEPTPAERETLRRHGVEERFESRRAFLRDHRNWHAVRKGISQTYRAALWAAFFLQLYFAVESESSFSSVEDYLQEKDADPENRVELLSETTPFPHVALRIGRRVYSYGVQNLTISTVSEYMMPGESKVLPLQRVVQSVRLNLSREQVAALKEDLESKRANSYRNLTLVNDCASMISRALARNGAFAIPAAIDASPAAVLQYLTLLKIKGDPRIGALRQIQVGGASSPKGMTARNFFVNAMETKYWMTSLFTNYPMRLALDGRYAEDIERRDPQVQEAIDEYRRQVEVSVRNSLEILGLEAAVESLPAAADSGVVVAQVKETIEALREPVRAAATTSGLDLMERQRAEESLLVLNTLESELLMKIKLKQGDLK